MGRTNGVSPTGSSEPPFYSWRAESTRGNNRKSQVEATHEGEVDDFLGPLEYPLKSRLFKLTL
jgi:hypothetical protein